MGVVDADTLVRVMQELYPEQSKVVFLTIANRQLDAEVRALREALEEGAKNDTAGSHVREF